MDVKATLNLNVQELYLTAQLLPKVGTGVCDDRDDVGQVTGGEGIDLSLLFSVFHQPITTNACICNVWCEGLVCVCVCVCMCVCVFVCVCV